MLHPGVDHPAAVDLFGGADLALGECVAEFEKCRTRLGIVLDLAQRGEALDGRFQGLHVRNRTSDHRSQTLAPDLV